MAHTCPTCGMLCHCNGDIDDICYGEADEFCSCCENDEDDLEDDWDVEDEPIADKPKDGENNSQ